MDKLLKLGRNSYFLQLSGQNYYFSPFNERADKKVENMVELTLRDFAAKIDELVEAVNILQAKLGV